jgi:MSHA biogenesis protein MshJ
MSLRERLMIGGTCCVLMLAIWFVSSFEPAAKIATQKMTELEAAKSRTEDANQNLELQVLALAGGSVQQRRRLEEVQRQIDALNTTLANYASELVDPNEMAIVLEGLLGNRPDLSLVRIRNLPSETLAASDDENATRFYRHGLEIELKGGYAGLVHYLEEIEDLPWRFYWQVLEVETLNYPDNRIRIEVSTLSLNEEWIGA